MAETPHSPDEVIDPRWNSYLRPGGGLRRTLPAQPVGGVPADELTAHMRAILARWEAGDQDPHETLEALRQLAERVL
jgi:hypothetical protein